MFNARTETLVRTCEETAALSRRFREDGRAELEKGMRETLFWKRGVD